MEEVVFCRLGLIGLAPEVEPRCWAVLDPAERARADRYRQPDDRRRFILGRGLARHVCAGLAGLSPRALDWHQPEGGKPVWANAAVPFNLSHSGDWVYLVAGGRRPLGVDVQVDDGRVDVAALARFVFGASAPAEVGKRPGFFRHWVAAEAAAKACGTGIFDPAQRPMLDLPDKAETWGFGTVGARAPVWVRPLPAAPHYAAALAVAGPSCPEIRLVAPSPAPFGCAETAAPCISP